MADTSAEINEKNEDHPNHPNHTTLFNIFLKIAENVQEPSTVFINNIERIYSFPKQDCVLHINQLEINLLNTLRDQLFFIFLDHFDNKTLQTNGFSTLNTSTKNSLKRRLKSLNSAYDIYNLGLSIQENQITNKLASEILKHQQQQPNTEEMNHQNKQNESPIFDTNNKTIIELLIQLTRQNSQLQKENYNLKDRVINIEAKLDRILATMPQAELTPVLPSTPTYHQHPANEQTIGNPSNNGADPDEETITHKPKITPSASYRDIALRSKFLPPKQTTPTNQKSSHQNKQASPSKSVIYGDRRNTKTDITGRTKPFSLFIGGFHIDLDENSVKSFIEKEADIQVIDIKTNRRNKYNQSFKVDINVHDKPKAFDSSNWVEGLIIKPYRTRRNSDNKNYNNYNHLNYYQQPNDHHHNDQYHNYNDQYQNSNDQYQNSNGWDQN